MLTTTVNNILDYSIQREVVRPVLEYPSLKLSLDILEWQQS